MNFIKSKAGDKNIPFRFYEQELSFLEGKKGNKKPIYHIEKILQKTINLEHLLNRRDSIVCIILGYQLHISKIDQRWEREVDGVCSQERNCISLLCFVPKAFSYKIHKYSDYQRK